MSGILDGIRVLELSQNAAIPTCGRLLAGLGADVVKVEPPGGDAMRMLAGLGPHESKAYASINPGKRSIVIDLTKDDSSEVVDALFAWADVALVAFKMDDLARYKIDWDHARTVNPRLVHLTHSPFGPEGPEAAQGGYDVLVQGRSGIGFVMNRSDEGFPQPTRPAVVDFSTGLTSAFAVMAGLRHRDQTGEGQRVDTSLLGTAMMLGIPTLSNFPSVDTEPFAELDEDLTAMRNAGVDFDTQRETYEDRVMVGHGAFRLYFRHYVTADGLISIAGMSAGLYERFHEITGIPAPGTNDHTAEPFQAAVAQAEELFTTKTTAEWIETLLAAGYPCGPYNMPYEAMEDPQVKANDYVVELDHAVFGPYTTVGMPVQFEKSDSALPGPSPAFAVHTDEVMAEAGLTPERIAKLAADEVILNREP